MDNVVQKGRVADGSFACRPDPSKDEYPDDSTVVGVRKLLRMLKEEKG